MPRFHRSIPDAVLRAARCAAAAAALSLAGCGSHDATQAGREHMARGDYAAAVIEFKNAVQAKPNASAPRVDLADALERANDSAGMEHNLRKALESGGDQAVLAPRIAFLMLQRNDLEGLLRDFKALRLKDAKADSDLRATVAMALVAQHHLAQAQEQMQDTAATPTVTLAQAQLLLADGRRGDALALLGHPAPDAQAPWWVLRAISRVAAVNGQPALALETIQRAQAAAPWNNALLGETGEALLAVDKVDEAGRMRDRLKKVAPRYFWTDYLDARLQARAGHVDETLAAAQRVLSAVPDHLPAALLAAAAELKRGENLGAHKRLMGVAVKYPSSLETLVLLADAQQRIGKPDEAAATVRNGLALAPDNLELLSLKTDIEIGQHQLNEAAATLTRMVARQPANATFVLRLAEVKAALRDKAAAAALLDRAAGIAGQDAALHDRVVAAALHMADLPHARRLADQAIAAMPGDPQTRLTLAATQAAQRDIGAAWTSVGAALDLKATYQPALTALDAMARTPAQHAEQLQRYAVAVDARPADPQTYLRYADLLRRAGKATKVTPASVLEKGMAACRDAIELRRALVDQAMRQGDAERALSIAQSGASTVDAPAAADLLLATTYERLGKTDLAAETYRKLIALLPQRRDWRIALARLDAAAGRTAAATTQLRGLITERPDDPAAYVLLAQLTAPSNATEALGLARQMAGRGELRLQGMLLEGDVLAMTGQHADALRKYGQAATAGAMPDALLGAATALDRLDRRAEADADVAEALRRFPRHPRVLGFAARRALAGGQPGRGVELMKKIVEQDPANPIALNDLAWAQVQAQQPEAAETARRADALLPDHPTVLDTLGVALRQAHRNDEAVAALRTAVNLEPTSPATQLHLAEALLASGDRAGAGRVTSGIRAEKLSPRDRTTLDALKATLTG